MGWEPSSQDDALAVYALLSAAFDPAQDIGIVCDAVLGAPPYDPDELFRFLVGAVVELGEYIEHTGGDVSKFVARFRAAALQCEADQ